MFSINYIIAFVLTGSLVGILSGMLGIGGGLIVVPVVASYLATVSLDLNIMQQATATSLLVVLLTTTSAGYNYYKANQVRLDFLLVLAPAIAIGSLAGRYLIHFIDSNHLAILFVAFTIWNALYLIIKTTFKTSRSVTQRKNNIILVILGAVTGLGGSMLGIGGGILLVPFLVRYITIGSEIVALSCVCGTVLSAMGIVSSIPLINWHVGLIISLFSVLTAPFGVKLGIRLSTNRLKQIFAVLLVLVSASMLFRLYY